MHLSVVFKFHLIVSPSNTGCRGEAQKEGATEDSETTSKDSACSSELVLQGEKGLSSVQLLLTVFKEVAILILGPTVYPPHYRSVTCMT